MHFLRYTACLAFSLFGAMSALAQDIMPEALPSRPKAERIVRETLPANAETTTSTAELALSYNADFGESVVKTSLQYLGAAYRSGMSGPSAFDCSGFTRYVYQQLNVPILRSSRSQFTQGTPIARISDLRKGDLVFFGGSRSRHSVGHVGIVTEVDPEGEGFSFVHASRTGVRVSESNEPYYSRRYIGARRIVEN